MSAAKPNTKRVGGLPLVLAAVGFVCLAALLLQHAVAVEIGRVLAGAWVSTMGAVMSLIGAMFGAH